MYLVGCFLSHTPRFCLFKKQILFFLKQFQVHRRYIDSHIFPAFTHTHIPLQQRSHQNGTFVMVDGLTLIHHYYPKSIVYIKTLVLYILWVWMDV